MSVYLIYAAQIFCFQYSIQLFCSCVQIILCVYAMPNTVLTSNHLQGGPLDSNKICSLQRTFYWKCLRSGSVTTHGIYHIWLKTPSQIWNQLLLDKGGPCKIYTLTDILQILSKMLCYRLLIVWSHHAQHLDLCKIMQSTHDLAWVLITIKFILSDSC
jgi:hypothetical protein